MSAQRKNAITVVKAETRQRLADFENENVDDLYEEALLNGYRKLFKDFNEALAAIIQ